MEAAQGGGRKESMKAVQVVGKVYKGCVVLETAERVVVVTPGEDVLGPFETPEAAEKFIDQGQAVIVKAGMIEKVH
jgi:hypothetical protein